MLVSREAPATIQCSTCAYLLSRLALKLFRGEPAISKLDWNFSPIHKSSPHFSTYVWFGPPRCLTTASTCSWIDRLVSGLHHATLPPYSDSVSLRLRNLGYLTSLHSVTRWPVLQKVRGNTLNSASSACKHRVSGSLSLPSRGPFHLSLTVLFLYRSFGSI